MIINTSQKHFTCQTFLLLLLLLFSFPFEGNATSIFPVPHAEGDNVRISVDIDSVSELAGIKIAVTYNKDAIKFLEATKTRATTSLMHVVNDKTPGKLIIVMAGAKGISGENISLVDLIFKRLADFQEGSEVVKIENIQLMDEKLRDIQVPLFNHGIK